MIRRSIFFGLLLIIALRHSNTAQSGASVEGQALDAKTGLPISGVQIKLLESSAISFDDGQFLITNIPAGRQSLTATKAGYVAATDDNRFLTIKPGQHLTDVRVGLMPSAIVVGQVVDASGNPVSGVTIRGYRMGYSPRGKYELQPPEDAVHGSSDDRGEFRISTNVAEGEYIFRAEPLPSTLLPYLFFPGTLDVHLAGTYRLTAAGQLDLGTITLAPRQGGSVVIHVSDGTGQEGIKAAIIDLMREDSPGVEFSGTVVGIGDSRGGIVGPLSTGVYTIRGMVGAPKSFVGQGRFNRSEFSVNGSFAIEDHDVTIDLWARKGPRITGNLQEKLPDGTLVPIPEVTLELIDRKQGKRIQLKSGPDGSFIVDCAFPGLYELISINSPGSDIALSSAVSGTDDVILHGLEISDKDLNLRFEFQKPAGVITGRVLNDTGNTLRGATVVLVGTDGRGAFQGPGLCHTINSVSDQNGTFELTVPTAGTYRVLAWKALLPCAPLNAEFLHKFEGSGATVRIEQVNQVEVDIRVLNVP